MGGAERDMTNLTHVHIYSTILLFAKGMTGNISPDMCYLTIQPSNECSRGTAFMCGILVISICIKCFFVIRFDQELDYAIMDKIPFLKL